MNRKLDLSEEKELVLNNASMVIKSLEIKEVDYPYVQVINGKYIDPIITEQNIKHNSEFIVDLFDEPVKIKKRKNR